MNQSAELKKGPIKKVMLLLATGFGFGLSPAAPGTVGCLWGIPLVIGVQYLPGLVWQVFAAGLLCLIAVPVCDAAEAAYGRKDDRRIVADEYLTFPLCMLGLPAVPWMLAVAFITNRVCDIFKPPPARGLQRLRGGLGIVIDDVIASIYSLALNYLFYWIISRYFIG